MMNAVSKNVYNKTWIAWFKANATRDKYEEVFNEKFNDKPRCRDCGRPVYYYDSIFAMEQGTNALYMKNKSCLSEKTVAGNTYNLSVCEECLSKKFPEYQTLNKGRVFNRICDITNYAFNIPDDVSNQWKSENYAITEENLIIKHGEVEGKKKWKTYCDKQAETNTYEYKKEKFGWSKQQFDDYNNSRAVTVENLTKRHGAEKGKEKWDNYVEQQRYTCTVDYFIDEYGEEEGIKKFNGFSDKRAEIIFSKASQLLFDAIVKKLNAPYTYYYYQHNGEFPIKGDRRTYFLDFYIKDLNIGIEYNGDFWHANPNKYDANECMNPYYPDKPASFFWEKDKERLTHIKTQLKDVIVVWESEYNGKGIEKLTDELVKLIKTYEEF